MTEDTTTAFTLAVGRPVREDLEGHSASGFVDFSVGLSVLVLAPNEKVQRAV